jgi:hypothetical protein
MRASGAMTKQMAMEYSWTLTMLCIQGSGLMTHSMAMGRSNGIMVPLAIKASSTKARKMAKEDSTGKTESTMRGSLSMDNSKASVCTILLTMTRPTKES